MAQQKARYFSIGLFMVVAIMVAIVLVIWLGASQYFRHGESYVSYFDESVQGLQRDSAVKYRGVEVGTVERIRVAPDGRLIEVLMKLRLKDGLQRDMVAELKMAGITGLVFIELDRKKPKEPDYTPKLSFTPDDPVIPTRPSDVKQILDGAGDIIAKASEIDFKGLSDEVKKLTRSLDQLVTSREVRGILKNIHSVTERLDKTTHPQVNAILERIDTLTKRLDTAAAGVERLTAQGHLEGVFQDARNVMGDTRGLIASLKSELEGMRLAEIGQKANRLTEELGRSGMAMSRELEAAITELRQAVENFDQLVDRVKTTPSELLFSKPPAPRRGE